MKLLFLNLDASTAEDPAKLKAAIRRSVATGYTVIGVAKRAEIEAGNKALEDVVNEMFDKLEYFSSLDSIYFCSDAVGSSFHFAVRFTSDRKDFVHRSFDTTSSLPDKGNPAMKAIGYHLFSLAKEQFRIKDIEEICLIGNAKDDECAQKTAEIFYPRTEFVLINQWVEGSLDKSEVENVLFITLDALLEPGAKEPSQAALARLEECKQQGLSIVGLFNAPPELGEEASLEMVGQILNTAPMLRSVYFCHDLEGKKAIKACAANGGTLPPINYPLAFSNSSLSLRMPSPGMIMAHIEVLLSLGKEIKHMVMVGNSEDEECARQAYMNFVHITKWLEVGLREWIGGSDLA